MREPQSIYRTGMDMLRPSSFSVKLIGILRLAKGSYRSWIARDFQTQLYKACGVRCIVLMAFTEKNKV